jgi:elongator complex protein 5
VHLICHPPALLIHLATSYLTPPPPLTPAAKFWGLFIPISERGHESDRLVFGPGGEGTGGGFTGEIIVEVLVRGGAEGTTRRKGVERALEGWSEARGGPSELSDLESLTAVWGRKLSGGTVGEVIDRFLRKVSKF